METNPQIELARRYIEQTGVSVFLTGKAGTGKTTFLKEMAAQCSKRHAIVAPTGVAAINAGGVTIHSFFQLPFDPYLPDVKELVTEYQMPDRFKSLSKNRLNIIRTLELLIIDEISMVRADLLDAIDMTLRRARRSSRPFGGVQLLMIGDVHQLPPVVTERERPYMEQVYPSPFFFSSKALQRIPYITIELTTVYRQQDSAFVELLNNVRDNRIDDATLKILNSRVVRPDDAERSAIKPVTSHNTAIILTTHNRQADSINRRHLDALTGQHRTFEAIVTGNFPDKAFPCDRTLEIREGERVMFLKNDTSGSHRYYNGKLATVTGFGLENDEVYIEVIDDDGNTIHAGREKWENLKYNIDPKTNDITQEIDGTFYQYPLQAAWAVTIHKAQGLTFDCVVIDAADAFAFGQVYVALSRCRTLEGLTLSTPLTAGVTFSDESVEQFVNSQPSFEQAASAAPQYQQQYRIEKLMELFSVDDILHLTERLYSHYSRIKNIYPTNVSSMLRLINSLVDLQNVSERFKSQLLYLDEPSQNTRASQGAKYYLSQIQATKHAIDALLDVEIDNKDTSKHIHEAGEHLSDALGLKLSCLSAVEEHGYSVAIVQKAKADYITHPTKKKKETNSRKKHRIEKVKPQNSQPNNITDTTHTSHKENIDLTTMIRRWRSAKASEEGLVPYMVLNQKALLSIVSAQPRTRLELSQLHGIGPKTIQRYGDELLAIVSEFIENNRE